MPRKSVRRRRRSPGCLSALISMLAVLAIVLVVAIVVTEKMDFSGIKVDEIPKTTVDADYLDPNRDDTTDHQMVLNVNTFSKTSVPEAAVNTPSPTPVPTPTPSPTPTPEPTYNPEEPYALVRPQSQGDGFLPIFNSANTDEKMIAITLSECSGAAITRKFCDLAVEYDAKLTLFPFGENILVTSMDKVLQKCVFELGFEIENAGYSYASRLYRMTDEAMAMEIWKQNMALNYVLGVDYQPHFLRVYGGNGENDPRTHAYLAQEGYLGFAGWNVIGSDMDYETMIQTLKSGNIYYFKTSEKDGEKMQMLMQVAKRAGYKMVTLNELFGYEANAYTEVAGSVLNETLPLLENYEPSYYTLRSGDCTWAVYQLQERLGALGYLPMGSADGVYGDATVGAICQFQADHGMAASGMANVETQELIFSDQVRRKNGE